MRGFVYFNAFGDRSEKIGLPSARFSVRVSQLFNNIKNAMPFAVTALSGLKGSCLQKGKAKAKGKEIFKKARLNLLLL